MGWASQTVQHRAVSQYYFGYLKDAVKTFEGVCERLKQCVDSLCDISDAIDMAHRIKGNAAMYDFVDLGLHAARLETTLRAATPHTDSTFLLIRIFAFIEEIQKICESELDSNSEQSEQILPPDSVEKTHATQGDAILFKRKRILLAYNDRWITDLVKSLLEPEFEVVAVQRRIEIYETLRQQAIDFAIFEDGFEDSKAIDVLGDIRALKQGQSVPVYIAFDPSDPDQIASAISQGVVGFTTDKHEILDITQFAKSYLEDKRETLLVVDDDPVVRDLLKHIFASEGYHVDFAKDGIEALSYLSEETPDLILLDRFMPRLEGGTVLYEIQNKINLKSIPVLILTAMVNRGEAQSWFERGAADFIPKPFDPEEVLMRVKQHLETKQNRECLNF